MSSPAATVVRRLVRSAATDTEASDRELLRRFAADGDQAAFTALVRRHAGMVLGVCRRALNNATDAEDACQATFVVLARKAGRGPWDTSIANWLYATARNVARNARLAADRRAKREGRAAIPEPVPPLDQMTGRELLGVLDQELDRLPARYREPLVLCYLQGLTRDEAAARLSVPPATVKSQLDRGRKRLAAALTRRGVSLGAGLLALAAASRCEAAPGRVIQTIVSSARGPVPRAVADLCGAAAPAGAGTRALVLAAAVVGAAALGMGAVQPQAAEPKPDKAATAKGAGKPAEPPGRTYSGRVVGPGDKPIPGAALLAFEADVAGRDPRTFRAVAGDDGRFRITLPADKPYAGGLFATAPGYGIGRAKGFQDAAHELTIQLVPDHPVAGRVVTTEGKPVAGVRLTIDRIADDVDDLDQLLGQVKAGNTREDIGHRRSMPVNRAELGTTAITDGDGKFRLTGGGKDRILYVDVRGDGLVAARLTVVNRPKFDSEPFNASTRKSGNRFDGRSVVHGPDLNLVAEREKLIRGRVTDAATGEPRAGVHVLLTRSRSDLLVTILDAWTDKDGRYEIRGARKAGGYMVEVAADPTAGYLQCQGWGEDAIGYEPVTIDLRVKRGVVVTGRIIDKATGKPIPGWALIGVPQANQSVKDYPAFNSSAWFPIQETDAEGRYRVVAIPGPVLLFGAPSNADFTKYKSPVADPAYPQLFKKMGDHTAYIMAGGLISPLQGRYCKVLEIKADSKQLEHDIELEPIEPPKKGEKKP